MASMYYVKVYYTKQQQQPEIRRFAIDISPENNIYQELGTKIATYQPDIQLNGFTLQYIDEENERITFSSNEELRSAIASNTDGTALKVFVTPNQQQQQQQQQQSTTNKECHTGVECDGCKGLVIGFRYKCVICPNYDLCENCSAAGVHSEHNMIKITKPGNYYHPYGPRHHGNGNGRRHHHRHTPPFIPSPEFFENIQAQIPQWLPNRENTAHLRQHMQQHFDSFRNNTQTHMQNSKQYLESVGQYLQQALSPFGIDCDYRVDDSTKNNNNQQQQQQQTASSSTTTTTATDENPTPTEPSAVPKDTDATSDTTNSNRGISSWLNMFRAGEGTASTITTDDTTEKAVEDCVEKMKAMGFDNPNNELMDLIRSKNGDLNSVLDEMTRYHQP